MRLIHVISALSVASFVLAGICYWMTPATNIAFFDKEAVQGQFIRQLAEIKASESQVTQSTRRFNEVLTKVLIDCASHKRVILKKNEVLAGGVDITDEVLLKLSKAMRNKL